MISVHEYHMGNHLTWNLELSSMRHNRTKVYTGSEIAALDWVGFGEAVVRLILDSID